MTAFAGLHKVAAAGCGCNRTGPAAPMHWRGGLLSFLIPIVMAAVALVLFIGIFGMMRGGNFNRQYGNKLMRLRVGLQFLAILLIAVAALLAGS